MVLEYHWETQLVALRVQRGDNQTTNIQCLVNLLIHRFKKNCIEQYGA